MTPLDFHFLPDIMAIGLALGFGFRVGWYFSRLIEEQICKPIQNFFTRIAR